MCGESLGSQSHSHVDRLSPTGWKPIGQVQFENSTVTFLVENSAFPHGPSG